MKLDALGGIILCPRWSRIVGIKICEPTNLPSEGGVPFSIYLLPPSYGTFATTSYMMSPLELVELKRRQEKIYTLLDDLLEHGLLEQDLLSYLDRFVFVLIDDILILGKLVDEPRFEVFSDHRSLRHLLIKKNHHLGKANVMVNSMSKKSSDLRESSSVCEVTLNSMKLGMLKVTSDLMEESREEVRL
ncbi:hypothetical protein CR513_35607, partial [Mucuna pruriens]